MQGGLTLVASAADSPEPRHPTPCGTLSGAGRRARHLPRAATLENFPGAVGVVEGQELGDAILVGYV
jgi:hypothetical protein